ncbi:MAG: hypothetical protein ABIH03_01045 [Pseudomonadota bacterium]
MNEQPGWMLKAEEIEASVEMAWDTLVRSGAPWPVDDVSYERRAVASAQAKKLMEWLLDGRGEYHHVPEAGRGECYCIYDLEWEQLRKDVGL